MPHFNHLSGPCFDLCWLRLSPSTTTPTTPSPEGSKEPALRCDDCVVLLPVGGGNKTKSGIANQIHVMKLHGATGFDLVTKFTTDDLCCAISGGNISGQTFYCGSYSDKCVLYSLSYDDDNQLSSKEITEFAFEELKDPEMTMNAILFTKNYLLTGGENGICYAWKVKRSGDSWSVEKVQELKHHNGPIKSFSLHPTKDWIASASDDGTCVVWDIKSLKTLGTIRCSADGLPGGVVAAKAGVTKKTSALKCRGAVFSFDGSSLFTVQCPGIGSSHLIRWSLEEQDLKEDQNKSSDSLKDPLTFSPLAAIKVSNVPSCRLIGTSSHRSDSEDPTADPILAYGDCEGVVSIFSMRDLKLISKDNCHDFPVTGLAVAPRIVLTTPGMDLDVRHVIVSCSADNKLSTILLREPPSRIQQLISLIVILLTAVLLLLILMKLKQNQEVVVG